MKTLSLALMFVLAVSVTGFESASAHDGGFYGSFGYGDYQPYGMRYSTSVRTPPYFAVNPPVYYGARHTRPYGISPFASLPVVSAPSSYTGSRATLNDPPRTGGVSGVPAETCNPCVSRSASVPAASSPAIGLVQVNPYVADDTRLAKK